MKRYSFMITAISFLAMVAGTAVADNSISKLVQASNRSEDHRCRQDIRNTEQSSGLNYVNGICTENPYMY
jgi:mitochondrial fission protein ELM1